MTPMTAHVNMAANRYANNELQSRYKQRKTAAPMDVTIFAIEPIMLIRIIK